MPEPPDDPLPPNVSVVLTGDLIRLRFTTTEGDIVDMHVHPARLAAAASMFAAAAQWCAGADVEIRRLYDRLEPLRALAPDAATPNELAAALGYTLAELIDLP